MAGLEPSIRAMLFESGFTEPDTTWLRHALWHFKSAALDLLFPPHCIDCNTPLPERCNKVLCVRCADKVRWIGVDRCICCGDSVGEGRGAVRECVSCQVHRLSFVRGAASVIKYEEGPARAMLLGLKFGGKNFLAETMGRILALRIVSTGLLAEQQHCTLVPAPLTRAMLFKRGYNQAGELAYWVGRELKLKVETRLLRKIRKTDPQAMLSEKRRRENLRGAFACPERIAKKYRGSAVLLIDDVITTGSTVSECARTLHAAGIKQIAAASFARG